MNNREIATIIWILIFIAWALTQKNIRTSLFSVLYNMLKALFVKSILIMIGSMLVYISLMVLILNNVGFWDRLAIKDTFLWTFGAFIMLLNSNKASDDDQFFKKVIIDNIKFVLVLEFVINIYSFGLVSELIIMPFVTFLVLIKTFTEFKPEYKQVEIVLGYVLSVFGIVLIFLTFRKIISDFQNFATLDNLRAFLLTPVLSIVYMPFIYLMALFMKYENIFFRIGIFNKDSEFLSLIKRKIFVLCHLDLWKLVKCSKDLDIIRASNRDDLLVAIQRFKDT